MPGKRPNILIMMADDHRFESIAAHGDPIVRTPTMDRLIQEGTSFTRNWHTGSYSEAVCIPTRAALHTGTHVYAASRHKDFRDQNPPDIHTINPKLPTLGQTLRQQGYSTFLTGKWHNDTASLNRSFGDGANIFLGGMHDHYSTPLFDFDPDGRYNDHQTHVTARHDTELYAGSAVDFLRRFKGADPFFLLVAFTSPHDPRQAPEKYRNMYRAGDIPLPANFLPRHPFDQGHNRIRDEELASFPREGPEIRRHLADYYAMISHQDDQMRLILEALEERGELENTVVVYTSDHGLAVGQHGLMGKQNLYEHSLRVPLIFRGPGIPRGEKSDALTQTPDAYPTICELAGVAVPETVSARSLVPVMRRRCPSQRTHLFSLYFDLQRAVCDGRFKLIRYYTRKYDGLDLSPGSEGIQLFDLEEDPWEMRNLNGDKTYDTVAKSLAEALRWHLDRQDDALKNVPVFPYPNASPVCPAFPRTQTH